MSKSRFFFSKFYCNATKFLFIFVSLGLFLLDSTDMREYVCKWFPVCFVLSGSGKTILRFLLKPCVLRVFQSSVANR